MVKNQRELCMLAKRHSGKRKDMDMNIIFCIYRKGKKRRVKNNNSNICTG